MGGEDNDPNKTKSTTMIVGKQDASGAQLKMLFLLMRG